MKNGRQLRKRNGRRPQKNKIKKMKDNLKKLLNKSTLIGSDMIVN
jgi:hypothetical protein